MEDYAEIDPELRYASPTLRTLLELGQDASSIGIDPGLALAIIAAVPVTLRVLRMGNEFTSAAAQDLVEKNRLKRKEQELAMEHKWHEKKVASKIRHKEYSPNGNGTEEFYRQAAEDFENEE